MSSEKTRYSDSELEEFIQMTLTMELMILHLLLKVLKRAQKHYLRKRMRS